MKKNRYIPFGYTMRNGRLVIEPTEAEVIRRIYEQYVDGATLKEIAEQLTLTGVPYSEKMTDWGKARVARIIENTKYLGDSEYDKIVDDSLFMEAAAAKKARQTAIPEHLSAELSAVKNRVHCHNCGYPMRRRSSRKYKTTTVWTCTNPECACKVGITDTDLLEEITRIMKRIKDNESLLDPPPNSPSVKSEKTRLTLDFEAALAENSVDEEKLSRLITAIACEEYAKIDPSEERNAEDLKRRIRRIGIQDQFSPDLFDAMVKSICLGSGDIEIVTKNNIEIGGTDGSQKDTEKDGYGNPADK